MQALTGVTILNTRPKHQSAPLSHLIKTHGGSTIDIPALEILPIANHAAERTTTESFDQSTPDIAIFVSANAVTFGHPNRYRPSVCIAIGPGTKHALHLCGVSAIMPSTYSTTGLLALKALNDVQGKHIIIFCGESTKPLLSTSLQQRGATVSLKVCYRRIPNALTQEEHALFDQSNLDYVLLTSHHAMLCFLKSLSSEIQSKIRTIPLVIVSDTMKDEALSRGFENIIQADNASDEALVDTIIQHRLSLTARETR